MESYRIGVFETNSSSCDALMYLDDNQFEMLKNNQIVITSDDSCIYTVDEFIQCLYEIIHEDCDCIYDEETDKFVGVQHESEIITKERLKEIINELVECGGCFDDHMSQMSFDRTFSMLKPEEVKPFHEAINRDPFSDGFAIGLRGLKNWGKLCWRMKIDEKGHGTHKIEFSTFG